MPATSAGGRERQNGRVATVTELGASDAATASVETRFVDPTAPTVLAFAGMGHGLQMPIAEFAGVLAPLAVNVLFVKDLQRCWYQHGVVGLGTSVPAAAYELAALVPRTSRLVGTVGTSSGGTGALLFGGALEVPVCMAFSPRTLVDDDAITRWGADVPDMPAVDTGAQTADLRRYLAHHSPARVDVHVGAGNDDDVAQVARIADLPGVHVTTHPTDWHPSAAWLRDQGELGRTLAAAFDLRLRPGCDFADSAAGQPDAPRRDWRPGPMWRAGRARLRELTGRDG